MLAVLYAKYRTMACQQAAPMITNIELPYTSRTPQRLNGPQRDLHGVEFSRAALYFTNFMFRNEPRSEATYVPATVLVERNGFHVQLPQCAYQQRFYESQKYRVALFAIFATLQANRTDNFRFYFADKRLFDYFDKDVANLAATGRLNPNSSLAKKNDVSNADILLPTLRLFEGREVLFEHTTARNKNQELQIKIGEFSDERLHDIIYETYSAKSSDMRGKSSQIVQGIISGLSAAGNDEVFRKPWAWDSVVDYPHIAEPQYKPNARTAFLAQPAYMYESNEQASIRIVSSAFGNRQNTLMQQEPQRMQSSAEAEPENAATQEAAVSLPNSNAPMSYSSGGRTERTQDLSSYKSPSSAIIKLGKGFGTKIVSYGTQTKYKFGYRSKKTVLRRTEGEVQAACATLDQSTQQEFLGQYAAVYTEYRQCDGETQVVCLFNTCALPRIRIQCDSREASQILSALQTEMQQDLVSVLAVGYYE